MQVSINCMYSSNKKYILIEHLLYALFILFIRLMFMLQQNTIIPSHYTAHMSTIMTVHSPAVPPLAIVMSPLMMVEVVGGLMYPISIGYLCPLSTASSLVSRKPNAKYDVQW